MKANKKGISLIVLIITIVVIIILAAAIILNLSNTNIIENANNAVDANDLAEMQSAVTLKVADIYAQKRAQPTTDEVLNGYVISAAEGTEGEEGYKPAVRISGITEDFGDFSTNYTLGSDFVVTVKAAQ